MFDIARRLRLATTAAMSILSLGSAAAFAGDDAEDVAKAVYRVVEKACPEDGDGVPYNLASIADAHFSPALRSALQRAYERRAIDFDILIDGQDCAIEDIDLDVDDEDEDRGHAVARAEFRNFGEPRDIELELVRVGSQWKVEDVLYRHRDWSARRDLETAGGK